MDTGNYEPTRNAPGSEEEVKSVMRRMVVALSFLAVSLWFGGYAHAFECKLPTIHERQYRDRHDIDGFPTKPGPSRLDVIRRAGRYKDGGPNIRGGGPRAPGARRTNPKKYLGPFANLYYGDTKRERLVNLKKECRHRQAVMNNPEIKEIIRNLPRMVTTKEVFLEKYPKSKRLMEVPISNHRPDVEDTYKWLAKVYDVADLKAMNAVCKRSVDLQLIEMKAHWGEYMDEKKITGWWWHYNREGSYALCLTDFTSGFLSKKMKRKKKVIRSLEVRFGLGG